jgi:hypothetical protein
MEFVNKAEGLTAVTWVVRVSRKLLNQWITEREVLRPAAIRKKFRILEDYI